MNAISSCDYAFGPEWLPDGHVRFRLWAPDAVRERQSVWLQIAGMAPVRMTPGDGGWLHAVARCGAGTRYQFRLEDGTTVPDPASRWQPDDVHGSSVLCLPTAARDFAWQCPAWRGRPWHEAILYEMHVGLCGGYSGAMNHLERLASMGFTAVELMPLAEFPGGRNWGYDGVLPFAPESSYGTPDELRALVDRAHCLGMMVLLDVVYNHFGPEGNYLSLYASDFFRADDQTPWGPAIDFRRPEVRGFFTENARYWLTDFRIDGLRLDAVHAIHDEGWLAELPHALRGSLAEAKGPARHIWLVLENDRNDASLLTSGYDAQWNDDAHHALHVLLTGEQDSYYRDYAESGTGGEGSPPLQHLARVLRDGFAWQGEVSPYRSQAQLDGRPDDGSPNTGQPIRRGQPSAHLPPSAFVDFLQNHDQTGNRAQGDRLLTLADPAAMRAAVALLLLCPHIPLVFMGDECGATDPFLYFTSHPPQLAEAVHAGRRREFAKSEAFRDDVLAAAIPPPNDLATFEASRPRFDMDNDWAHYYRTLLAIRRVVLLPHLPGCCSEGVSILGDAALRADWRFGDGARLSLWLNLGYAPVRCAAPIAGFALLHESGMGLEAPLRGGTLMPLSCVAMLHGRDAHAA